MMMELPLLAQTSGDILEQFLMKHSLVCSQFGSFSFSSKIFQPDFEENPSMASTRPIQKETKNQKPQSSSNRTYLRGKYAPEKLYQTTKDVLANNLLEIGLSSGDLVGVIQQKDPMGDTSRWFCDNGDSQGFVDASFLVPLDVITQNS